MTVVSRWACDSGFASSPQSGLAWFCFLLPSRPGEFRPEPLTDPCLTVSGHTARATSGRPAPSAEIIGFLLLPTRIPRMRRTSRGTVICPLLVILACFCILASLIPEDLLARALVYVGDAGATSIDPHHSAARSYSLRETFMMFTTFTNGRTTYGRAFCVKAPPDPANALSS